MIETPIVHSPTTLAEAYAMLAESPGRARVLAGGTDLLVLMNARQLDDPAFLNIWGIDELRGIRETDSLVRIGALTTFTQLIRSDLIQQYAPSLVSAARTVGAIQIQNRATLGGNIV